MANSTAGIIYLNVPYHEKDVAKGLGAKWDRLRKKWYASRWTIAENPRLCRWLEAGSKLAEQAKAAADFIAGSSRQERRASTASKPAAVPKRDRKPKASSSGPVTTPRTDFRLVECSCKVPPWESCEHSDLAAALYLASTGPHQVGSG